MSDLATAGRLRQASTQFPVSWYCDPRVLEAEQRLAARARARLCRATSSWCPNVGDFQALAARGDAQMLVRNANGVELLSNVCRHRQALMYNGRGNTRNIVCPLHRWTYDLKGELLGAPHFADKPCLNLGRTPLQHWNGLLFDGPRDVAQRPGRAGRQALRLLGLHARPRRDAPVQLQLEDVHRGLSRGLPRRAVPSGPGPVRHLRRPEVGIRRLVLGADGRHQQQPVQARLADLRALAQGGARFLSRRDPAARRGLAHVLPEHHARVVSARARHQHADPARPSTRRSTSSSSTTPRRSRCSSASSSRPSRPRTWRRRRKTTRSPSGWMPAAARCTASGRSEIGPYQSPMEDGMQHFHEFYRREMEAHIAHL